MPVPLILRQKATWGALLSVIAVAAGVAAFLMPAGSPDASLPNAQPVDVVRVGQPAPRFVMETLDGTPFDLAAATGRPVWINVWASWCPPCRAEMPDVNEVQAAASEQGLIFLAVNDGEPAPAIASYLEKTGYDFRVGIDRDAQFVDRYRVLGLPTHIFIRADGTLADLRVGSMTRAEMEQTTRDMLRGLDAADTAGVGPTTARHGDPAATTP